MRSRRLALIGAAIVVLGAAAAVAVLRATAGDGGGIALLGAVPRDAAAVRVDGAELIAGHRSVALPLRPAELARAPEPADLGVFSVPSGHYDGVRLRLANGGIAGASLDLRVGSGSLEPLLLVVDGGRLTAYTGNERVNDGLLIASGRVVPIPDLRLTDQHGAPVSLGGERGRVTVVAAITTHCHESCPLYAAVLDQVRRVLEARGWNDRVDLVSVTMDPWRDTPPVLAAYGRMVGAGWTMLTGTPGAVTSFWAALGASFHRVPYQGTPPVDWYTGGPESFDIAHDSLAVVVDQRGDARFWLLGNPRLGGGLSPALTRLLAPDAPLSHLEQTATWSTTDLLDRIDILLHEPPERDRGTEAAARRGAPAPGFALPGVSGPAVSLGDEAGHPVLLNFWATWCGPCRAELPRLARAAAAHPELRVLAVDEGEQRGDVERYLRDVLGAGGSALTVLLDAGHAVEQRYGVSGLPVSVFIDAGGTVRLVHVGEVDDATLARGLSTIGAATAAG